MNYGGTTSGGGASLSSGGHRGDGGDGGDGGEGGGLYGVGLWAMAFNAVPSPTMTVTMTMTTLLNYSPFTTTPTPIDIDVASSPTIQSVDPILSVDSSYGIGDTYQDTHQHTRQASGGGGPRRGLIP